MPIYDIHTHRPDATDAIISISPADVMLPGKLYSVGIHPWDADSYCDIAQLEQCAALPQVVAIGETGLDALCGTDQRRQMELLRIHAALAERYCKPLILHIVRRYSEILALHKELRPAVAWIIHGYRSKPEMTRQLLSHGFSLSIGEKYNAASLALIPTDRLFTETDESPLPIAEIDARAGLPLRDYSASFFLPQW